VHCEECEFYPLYLHAFHQLAREVQARGRSGNGAFVLGEYALEALDVFLFGLALDDFGQRRLAQCVELLLELVVRAVVEEAQRSAAARGVVDYFGHYAAILAKEELVAYSYLACRVDKHIPQAQLRIKLAQEEHFDTCPCFFL